jgi:hypothetical protein
VWRSRAFTVSAIVVKKDAVTFFAEFVCEIGADGDVAAVAVRKEQGRARVFGGKPPGNDGLAVLGFERHFLHAIRQRPIAVGKAGREIDHAVFAGEGEHDGGEIEREDDAKEAEQGAWLISLVFSAHGMPTPIILL